MRKAALVFGIVVLALGTTGLTARAQSGTIGCGPGSGATISGAATCGGSVTTTTSGSTTSYSGIMTSAITGVSGVGPGALAAIDDLTPNSELFSFSFNYATGSGGTFTLADGSNVKGDSDFTLTGNVTSLQASLPNGSGQVTLFLGLQITGASISLDNGTSLFSGSVTGNIVGSVTIVDPANSVSSMTGTVGIPVPGGVTPEPGTLILLGSGLLGLAPFVRRRLTA